MATYQGEFGTAVDLPDTGNFQPEYGTAANVSAAAAQGGSAQPDAGAQRDAIAQALQAQQGGGGGGWGGYQQPDMSAYYSAMAQRQAPDMSAYYAAMPSPSYGGGAAPDYAGMAAARMAAAGGGGGAPDWSSVFSPQAMDARGQQATAAGGDWLARLMQGQQDLYDQQLREGIDPGTIAFYQKGYGGGYGGGYSGGSYEGSASATPGGRSGGSGMGYDPNSPGGYGIGGVLYGWQNALQQGGTVPGIKGKLPTIINGIPVQWTGDSSVGGGGSDAGISSSSGTWSPTQWGDTTGVFGPESPQGIPIGYQPVQFQPNQPDQFNPSVNTNYGYSRSSQDYNPVTDPYNSAFTSFNQNGINDAFSQFYDTPYGTLSNTVSPTWGQTPSDFYGVSNPMGDFNPGTFDNSYSVDPGFAGEGWGGYGEGAPY